MHGTASVNSGRFSRALSSPLWAHTTALKNLSWTRTTGRARKRASSSLQPPGGETEYDRQRASTRARRCQESAS
eukprot:3076814-Rhodomonas_salina.2